MHGNKYENYNKDYVRTHGAAHSDGAVRGRKKMSIRLKNIALLTLAAILAVTLVPALGGAPMGAGQAYSAAPNFTAISNTPSLSTIYVKKGASINIKGGYLSSGDKVLGYKSSKTAVATVSGSGKVKAKKTGTVTITLTTKKAKRDTIKVVVLAKSAPARSIKITAKKSINAKQVVRLSVTTNPKKTTSTVKWTSSQKSVATVDAAGYITAKKAGQTTIKAKTSNGKTASCTLTVKDPVTISSTSANVRMDRPQGTKLTASAPSGVIIWSSSDASVATVSKDGVVVGKKEGAVNITATSKASNTKAVCRVTVVPHIKSTDISLSPNKVSIYAEKTTTLKATLVSAVEGAKSNDDIIWSSSNAKIATVSSTGVVTGVNYGVVNITAKAESGATATAEITVHTIKPNQSQVIITPGMRYKASFAFYGASTATGATYTSSDTSVATVSSAGTVSANLRNKTTGKAKAGTVTITVKTKNGDTGVMKVIVRDEPTIIDVSKWQDNINWATTSKSVDLAILRVMYGPDTSTEKKYPSYADSCKQYGVPFGVYAYVTYKTKAQAESQATVFYNQAKSNGRQPKFFVVDTEDSYITRANTEAYIAKLRSLAKADGIERLKVGVYIGHHLYKSLNLNLTTSKTNAKTPDFVWIPRYNSNIGVRTASMLIPDYACDIWQYSSAGSIPGISGDTDVSTITSVDGNALTKKSTFSFEWLIAGPEAK